MARFTPTAPRNTPARHTELAEHYLPDELLERFRERAAEYDRENRFFDEDLTELKERGYLQAFVPESHGGPGLGLNDVSKLQQRLATAAPATALAINMHLMCTSVVKTMVDRGDDSLAWVFDEAMAGEIFAFGISEPGNDWVLQDSTSTATPDGNGGYTVTGVKIFTSLSPVWTRLIVHGRDAEDPTRMVYGFIERDAPGITVSDDWDVLGMRASHSRATILTDAPMRADRVARFIPVGQHPDLLVFGIVNGFQLLIASVYAGIARRALDLAAASLHKRRSAQAGTTLNEVPEWRIRLADAHMDFMSVPAQIELSCRDIDDLVDHGAEWPLRLVSTRLNASTAARRTVETALMCASGSGFGNSNELSRLLRDATAGLFHPPSADAARPMYAAALLDD